MKVLPCEQASTKERRFRREGKKRSKKGVFRGTDLSINKTYYIKNDSAIRTKILMRPMERRLEKLRGEMEKKKTG